MKKKTTFARVAICLALLLMCLDAGVTFGQEDGEENSPYLSNNVAAAANGGVATASSTASANFPAASATDGDRRGNNWGVGGGWNDATPGAFPDWLEVQFSGPKSISEVDIFTLQDNFQTAGEPSTGATFTLYGITDFEAQYWDGASWVSLGRRQSHNVWKQYKFASVTTSKIRVVVYNGVNNGAGNYSRIVELEAWGTDALAQIFEPTLPGPNPTPTPVCEKHPGAKMDPCELSRNLLHAMKNNGTGTPPYGPDGNQTTSPYWRSARWSSQLDWNFGSWRNYGSQNKPLLAHAMALWRSPSDYSSTFPALDDAGRPFNQTDAAVNWWKRFLDCQTRDVACSVTNPVMLQYWKGAELFSNTYDGEINAAVIAVRYWAVQQLRTLPQGSARYNFIIDLAYKTGRYLRLNWALYSLGAGKSGATKLYTRYNHTDSPPYEDPPHQGCRGSSFNGPFIPLAGMRSSPQHTCVEDRGPMLARALGWAYNGAKETDHLRDLLEYVELLPPSQTAFPNENAYSLDDNIRGILRDHINNGSQASSLLAFLAPIRTAVPYHFVGATSNGQQARLTLMEGNATTETTPTFAITYDFGLKLGRVLFPWPNRPARPGCSTTYPNKPWRGTETHGYAQFRPNLFAPTSVFASSREPVTDQGHCKNFDDNGNPIEEEFSLPSNWMWKYHIEFKPNAPPENL